MKIFVSYSRRDAGDFANQIHESLRDEHQVFTDIKNIQLGDIWSDTIEKNISTGDVFVVIITGAALKSTEVEKEILQAQRENKKIIPCIYGGIKKDEIKWGLDKIQGIEFTNEFQLARELYSKINVEYNSNKISSGISRPISNTVNTSFYSDKNTVDNVKTETVLTGSDDVMRDQQKNLSQSPKEGTVATGNKLSTSKDTIKKYRFINSWGLKGKGDGQFKSPIYIAVDSSKGYVYIVDQYNNRIQKFDRNGKFITKWGSKGTKGGQFDSPLEMAVDSSEGEVYVTDYSNHRIQKFDSNGNFITEWTGYTEDKFYPSPRGIAVDSSKGYVYVAYYEKDRIQKFDSNGNFITKWGSKGYAMGEFDWPVCIAVDSSKGYVYVADRNNHRIQKFDSNGNFITKWGNKGTGDGQFDYPLGIIVEESTGCVYVVDSNNHRIQKFDSDGKFITKWGMKGTGDGQFKNPVGIAVNSSSGYVYVADTDNNRIQVFAPITK